MIMDLSRSNRYFRTICRLVYDNKYGQSYTKLFEYLYLRDFYWDNTDLALQLDSNRARDGIDLRYKYGCSNDISDPCSVLEMLIALAVRIENQYMTSYDEGDRTGQWFWVMISNLGLNRLDDDNFDEDMADLLVDRFLNREYCEDGSEGGLFVIERPFQDLREIDIWTQANWYLGEMDGYL